MITRARALAAKQHGLLTWDQLLRSGFAPSTVADWQRRGQLQRIAPSVYRLAGAPETWNQLVMRAVLDTHGLASHRTAAALHDLDGHRRSIIEVVVERWHRSSSRVGYKVHETKDLRAIDVDARLGIPCTSLVRTLLDLPAAEHPFRAEQGLDDACRKDPNLLPVLRARFQQVARRGRNGTTVMRSFLRERPGGYIPPASTFERQALRWIEGTSIPTPVKQFQIVDGDFTAFFDLAWPEVRFGMECDSLAFHFTKAQQAWDRRRRRRLKRLGWEIAEWTYDEVKSGTFIPELRQLLVLASRTAEYRTG